jgi:glycosyltransferase involved in cell wall biosynthesis
VRVTFVAFDDEPPQGGQGVMLRGMRRTLSERDVDTRVISGRGEHAIRFAAVTRRPPLDLSLWLNRHPELITRTQPDIVHAHGGPGGVLLVRRLDVPVVYTAHHTYRQAFAVGDPRRVLAPVEALALRGAARVLAVSESTADAVRAMHVPASRVDVVPPGVELPPLDPAAREPGTMLYAGRLEREKNPLSAIAVMRRVIANRPGWRGVVIGGGRLDRAVREAAAGCSRIEVLGRVDDDTLSRELARASVLLMPSRFEGLGLVALEAQARATPVVGYDVTGLRDAVRDGGILVPAGDVEALRRACLRVLEDDVLAAELGARGRAFVTREHSWDVIGTVLLQAYAAVRR